MGHQRDLALSARSFLRPTTQRRIPLNPDLGYWGGVTWVYSCNFVNGGANAGDQLIAVVPGEGNEFEVMYGSIRQGDNVTRVVEAEIWDSIDKNFWISFLLPFNGTRGGGALTGFPVTDLSSTGNEAARAARWIVSGTMALFVGVDDVAVNQDSRVVVVARVRGDLPTVTPIMPDGATHTLQINRFF